MKEYFSQYGKIEEVKILIKADGKPVGCGFIQFDHVQSAAKAIHYANMKPLQGRSVVVDWAVPKNKFKKNAMEDVKEENDVDIDIKKEPDELDDDDEQIGNTDDEINLFDKSDKNMDV